jgi:AcrR family transcriptional regulator
VAAASREDILSLTDRTTERAQRRPEEKRARLLAAARAIFSESGYGASVHDICRAAGVGIGTFYHQFPDKAELMRHLMQEEHNYRVTGLDAIAGADDPAAEIARILAGADPRLLAAMIDACGLDPRLRGFGVELRKATQERLAAAFERARADRGSRSPALDAATAAWATLALHDAVLGRAPETAKIVEILAFAEADGERIRA